MIRMIAVAFGLTLASSAQAVPVAPIQQPDSIVTTVREACGAAGHELMVSAWPEPPNDKSDGMSAAPRRGREFAIMTSRSAAPA